MSMKAIWERLKAVGQEIQKSFRGIDEEEEYDGEKFYVHHKKCGHNLEECWEFRCLVQELMNLGVVNVEKKFAIVEKEVVVMRKEDQGFHPSVLKVLSNPTLELVTPKVFVKSSIIVVRTFDGTRREALGDIVLPLEIGPSKFNVNFQGLDQSSYCKSDVSEFNTCHYDCYIANGALPTLPNIALNLSNLHNGNGQFVLTYVRFERVEVYTFFCFTLEG
ncbi:hypothetical protein L6164_023971 [Bauhinia variegata]|uniref:Uncharacterized protein n=1 Tax=Bauhinia variegata TaxID=167791 RepID=A0ACB9LWG3_BAUVA|nr:hypothetical protein L6164_023971 [Bauhinia variegata]